MAAFTDSELEGLGRVHTHRCQRVLVGYYINLMYVKSISVGIKIISGKSLCQK